jgi:cytochrome c biogenesis protein CcmG/thiol:disulfide interchange protein DsbE
MNGKAERSSALIGRPAPLTVLPPPAGIAAPALNLAAQSDKRPVLVNIFASWCAPCRLEHPLLMALAAEGDFTIAGLAYKDAPDDTAAFLASLGNPFAMIGFDGTGRAAIEWGVAKVPETFLVGADGRVIAHVAGPLNPAEINRLKRAAGLPAETPRAAPVTERP